MNEWEQGFSRKMKVLNEQSFACFDGFADDVLEPTFRNILDFVTKWKFRASVPQSNEGQRTFRFALTEDGYVLVLFRLEGIDGIGCDCEYSIPGKGRIAGLRTSASLRGTDDTWAESCFQTALDEFITKFSEAHAQQEKTEVTLK